MKNKENSERTEEGFPYKINCRDPETESRFVKNNKNENSV